MIRAVLFDFDGTIIDSLRHMLPSWKGAFALQGRDLSEEDIIRNVFYKSDEELAAAYNIDIGKLIGDFHRVLDEAYKKLQMQESVDLVLMKLKERGIKTAIVSMSNSERIEKTLESLGLERVFDTVLGRNDAKLKPHPEIARKAMKALDVSERETLLVGDTAIDIQTGKNAGTMTALYLPPIHALYTDAEAARSLNPDFEFPHFSDFFAHFDRFS